jgi:outer membrane receptor protein involved in Fe transport
LKFGSEWLRLQTGIRDVSALLGSFTFSGRFSGQNGQYQGGVADLLMGLPTRYQQDSNTVFNLFQNLYSAYAQDDWKVSPKLTLNLGLRYEFATPPRERDLQWANFDPTSRKFAEARSGSLFEESLLHPDLNNFAPRIGFAWSPLARTVLRGAYGIFYNHTNRMGREGLLGFNLPFMVLADSPVPSGTGTLKSAQTPFRLQDGVPAGFVDLTRVNPATVARKAQDPNQRTTYIQQWNLGVQRELSANLLLDLAYVGNRGTKLAAFRNLNQLSVSFNPTTGAPIPGLRPLADAGLSGNIQMLENLGVSNYHSFQSRLEKRFSRGLSALVSYTWGKALTNAPDHLSTSALVNGVDVGVYKEPQNPQDRRSEYGLAEFDVAHRFVASAVWQLPYRDGSSGGRGRKLLFENASRTTEPRR